MKLGQNVHPKVFRDIQQFNHQTKHIEIDCHLVQHHLLQGSLQLISISSYNQLADIFTKLHLIGRFRDLVSKLQLVSHPPPSLRGAVNIIISSLGFGLQPVYIFTCASLPFLVQHITCAPLIFLIHYSYASYIKALYCIVLLTLIYKELFIILIDQNDKFISLPYFLLYNTISV